jgi:hypothetical protein
MKSWLNTGPDVRVGSMEKTSPAKISVVKVFKLSALVCLCGHIRPLSTAAGRVGGGVNRGGVVPPMIQERLLPWGTPLQPPYA